MLTDGDDDKSLQLLLGVFVAFGFIAYGVYSIVTQHSWFIGGGRGLPGKTMEVYGHLAIELGICSIALGVFLHNRFLWKPRFPVWQVTTAVEFIAALTWLGFFIAFIARVLQSWS